MPKDPIIDEVRRAREDEAAKYDFDIKAIINASRERQVQSGHKTVSLARKQNSSA